jgi:hypothetical protein
MFIYCNGFWRGFKENIDGVNFSFFKYILEKALNTDIILTDNWKNADILLETHNCNSLIHHKAWKYSLFYSGEGLHGLPPNYKKYSIILGTIDSGENFVNCPLFIVYEFCKPFNYPKNISELPQNDIVVVQTTHHNNSYRAILIDKLIDLGYKIDFAGRHKNNTGAHIPGSWYEPQIIQFMKNYKFVLSLENIKIQTYITEKIINALRAGSIPIYYGSDEIDKYFNKERIIIVNENNLEEVKKEIDRLLSDPEYWLRKVNSNIFITPINNLIIDIINKIKQLISNKKIAVNVICNSEFESERLKTLKTLLTHFDILPNYSVWGENTKIHKYYNKFTSGINTPARSLCINYINCFEQYSNSNKYLLMFESDCIPLDNLDKIEKKIQDTIQIMEKNDIDFVFICKGCFQNININDTRINVNHQRCINNIDFKNIQCFDNILYLTNASRCTEAFLVSPKGIKSYLEYFYSRNDHITIDLDFNCFFYETKVKSCWLIPELFKQYGYRGNIPFSEL